MSDDDIRRSAIRYIEAVRSLHAAHSSIAVHGEAVGGRMMTPHCSWQCNTLDAHAEQREEYAAAEDDLCKRLNVVYVPKVGVRGLGARIE